MAKLLDTDNFGRDYPNEQFLLWPMPAHFLERIAKVLNEWAGPRSDRYYRVVEDDYVLAEQFEP